MAPQNNDPVRRKSKERSKRPSGRGLAIASLVCGIVALFTLLLTGIPAIICGHMARHRIKRSRGGRRGQGMATGGLVLGYLSIFITLVSMPLIMEMIQKKQKGQLLESVVNAKQLYYVFLEYEADHGAFPTSLEEFESEGYMTVSVSELAPAEGGQWIYFSGQSSRDNDENILLASPTLIDDERVILRINGSVTSIPDAEYQAAVKALQSQ